MDRAAGESIYPTFSHRQSDITVSTLYNIFSLLGMYCS